ncbi:selenocysteine lyase/cysteine desulfurase [Arthrobacter globiformis]|nr:selenocysteine lyase/cysteine desulfurase [Arthrobacter globiformis]
MSSPRTRMTNRCDDESSNCASRAGVHDIAVGAKPATGAKDIDNADVLRIRADFPALDQEVNGKRLIYLDSGATSQNPFAVIEAEQAFYQERNAAVHRGAHSVAVEAAEVFEEARQTVGQFVGAAEDEIIWVSNATEAVNALSCAFSNATLWGARQRGGAELAPFILGPGR